MQYALKVTSLEYFESRKETFSMARAANQRMSSKARSYFVLKTYFLINVNHNVPRCSVKKEWQILKYKLNK